MISGRTTDITTRAGAGFLPSPLEFALEAIEGEGALVERDDSGATALLPPKLSTRFEIPEECRLTLFPERDGDVGVGLGSPLLERLVSEARAHAPATSVRIDLDPPRAGHITSVAARFVLRNGLCDVLQVSTGSATYVDARIAYVVEADDRREGLTRVVVNASDGGEPDDALTAHLDLSWPEALVRPTAAPVPAAGAARWLAPRADSAVRSVVARHLDDVGRRHARDHERITSYFTDLCAEARTPRRRADPKVIDAKIAHLVADRDAKLRGLGARFAVKVTYSVAALVVAEVPAAFVQARLRRRKETREIMLRLPAGAHSVDKVACEGCNGVTAKPAACDDRMHLLCEACAPNAQGRIACPACGRRK